MNLIADTKAPAIHFLTHLYEAAIVGKFQCHLKAFASETKYKWNILLLSIKKKSM